MVRAGGPDDGFLSTLPARGATYMSFCCLLDGAISIHAPREGSDPCLYAPPAKGDHFYPRSPRGERRQNAAETTSHGDFYPRSPRGELRPGPDGDRRPADFYPRSPRGERPIWARASTWSVLFLSTLPARGATAFSQFEVAWCNQFLSTLPARGATLR